MSTFAKDTEVSVGKTRAEMEDLLSRYGATAFGSMIEPKRAAIAFQLNGKHVRFFLPLPDPADRKFTRRTRRSPSGYVSDLGPCGPEEARAKWEQACRSKWRALFLSIKAKLVACEEGITTFEEEFLAHFVIPGGGTIGDRVIPQLLEMQTSGRIPTLQLMGGAA